jgi:urease
MADLAFWDFDSFGARPNMVVKGGVIAWAQVSLSRFTKILLMIQMGDANGSIPTVQPVIGRPMWGYHPSAAALNSVVWVSQASVDNGMSPPSESLTVIGKIASYGLKKRAEPVKNCRKITKKDMKLNDAMPKMSGTWCLVEMNLN